MIKFITYFLKKHSTKSNPNSEQEDKSKIKLKKSTKK